MSRSGAVKTVFVDLVPFELCFHKEVARDLVQEAFPAAYLSLGQLKDESYLYGEFLQWLYSMCLFHFGFFSFFYESGSQTQVRKMRGARQMVPP